MDTNTALRRIEANIRTVMAHVVSRSPSEDNLGAPSMATEAALEALDEGIEIFARSATGKDPDGAFVRAAMRLFYCCLYLGSIWRAKLVRELAKSLGDGDANQLRHAYTSYFLMHWAIRTGDIPEAKLAYSELQSIERIPRALEGPDAWKATVTSVFDAHWQPARRSGGRVEIVLPSPPLLVKSYQLNGRPPGDRFPLQHLTGREGHRWILANAEINRFRIFAVAGEPQKTQLAFEAALTPERLRGLTSFLVPAVITAASAWGRAGDPDHTEEVLRRLPPEPWATRPVYRQLKRLCMIEACRVSGQLDRAQELHRDWPTEGLRGLHAMPWTIGTARLAGALLRSGARADAERVACRLWNMGRDISLVAIRIETALNIMDSFAARGRFRKAEKVFRSIESMGSGFHPSVAWSLYRGEMEKLRSAAHGILLARHAAKGLPVRRDNAPVVAVACPEPWDDLDLPREAFHYAHAAKSGLGPSFGEEFGESIANAVQTEAINARATARICPNQPSGGAASFGIAAEDLTPAEGAGLVSPHGSPLAPSATPAVWTPPDGNGHSLATSRIPPESVRKAADILTMRVVCLLNRGTARAAAQALSAFDAIPGAGSLLPARFGLAAKIITRFGLEGDLRSAGALYRATAMSPAAKEAPRLLCLPALSLMNACLAAGTPAPAVNVFASIPLDKAPSDTLPLLGAAASRVARALLVSGDFDRAEALHRDMSRLGAAPEAAILRARTSLDLVMAFEAAGLPDRSMAAYLRMDRFPASPETVRARSLALRCLISGAARSGRYVRAIALKNTLNSFGPGREAHLLRLRALHELISLSSETSSIPALLPAPNPDRAPWPTPRTPIQPHLTVVGGLGLPLTEARIIADREARDKEAMEKAAPEKAARERERQKKVIPEREFRERRARKKEAPERESRERESREREARKREALEKESREREARKKEAREREIAPAGVSGRTEAPGTLRDGTAASAAHGGRISDNLSDRDLSAASVMPWYRITAEWQGRPPDQASASRQAPVPCPEAARLTRHLKAGNLPMAEAFFALADLDDILPANAEAWAAALEGLAGLYMTRSKPEGATRVFAATGEALSGSLKPLAEARARIGARLARWHAERGRLDDGLAVYARLAASAVTPAIAAARARAVAVLVPRLTVAGRLTEALAVCLGLRALPRVPEVREALTETGSALISRLEGLPDMAAELCRGITEAGCGTFLASDAVARVILFFAAAGRHGRATSFFRDFMSRHPLESFPPDTLRPIAWALATLAESCRSAGMMSQAQAIYRHLLHPAFRGLSPELRACLETGGEGCPGAGAPGLPLPACARLCSVRAGEAPAPGGACRMFATCRNAKRILKLLN
ncbi:MAG: hypothetical protein LBR80_18795 [Deltaproteobacteria bacterium]|jgi:hypothetical protein|nr:hypothetical protein [Deltaproteobacteria bacterium]